MHLCHARPGRGVGAHLGHEVGEEEQLAIRRARDERKFLATVNHLEAVVGHSILATHLLQVALPRLAVRWVGEHEVEPLGAEAVVGQRRLIPDVRRVFPGSLQDHVGRADGVRLRVDLLPEESGAYLLASAGGDGSERLIGHGQHPAGPARAVIDGVGARHDRSCHRPERQLGHEAHRVARRPVFARLLVVLLIEPPDQLLEDGPHGMVIHRLRRQVHIGRREPGHQLRQCVNPRERVELVAELELVDDLDDVGRKAVKVGLEVCLQLLALVCGRQVGQAEPRGIVEGLPRGGTKGTALVLRGEAICGEERVLVAHRLAGRFEDGVEASQDAHGEDDIRVLAPLEQVPEYVVGDAPDEADEAGVGRGIHMNTF